MIRPLEKQDYKAVIDIVNHNWKTVYNGYINPYLIDEAGCIERENELEIEFDTGSLENYVMEADGKVVGLLSFGDTEDEDIKGAFEIWRVYIHPDYQSKGIGRLFMNFALKNAVEKGYKQSVIWAFKNNSRAINFYLKSGYVIDKEEYLGEYYKAVGVRLLKQLDK